MPELATSQDVRRLEELLRRQSRTLTVRLGGLFIVGSILLLLVSATP